MYTKTLFFANRFLLKNKANLREVLEDFKAILAVLGREIGQLGDT